MRSSEFNVGNKYLKTIAGKCEKVEGIPGTVGAHVREGPPLPQGIREGFTEEVTVHQGLPDECQLLARKG